MPVDPACWEARSCCRAKAWLVPYELAVGELSPRLAQRDFLPWWAAVGCCRLSAWLGTDVKPDDVARPGAREREDPPLMGSGRHQAIADATGRSARPAASEVHHG